MDILNGSISTRRLTDISTRPASILRYLLFLAVPLLYHTEGRSQNTNSLLLSCLVSEFRPDTTYHNQHSVRFVPLRRDSLFLNEEVHASNYERMSKREFERLMEKYQYEDFRSYYFRFMSRGVANGLVFQDFQYRTDNTGDIKLTYVRYLIPNVASPYVKQSVISIAYSAYIPRVWEAGEKWNASLDHFKEKIARIEELFSDCRMREGAE